METLRYVLLANGLVAVISITYYVLLRRETFFGANRLALWVGLAASLGLPLLELPDWRPQPVKTVMQRTARVIVPKVLSNSSALQPNVTSTFPNGQPYPAMQQPALVWSWQTWLFRIYVAGVLLLLIRFGIRLALLGWLIRKSVHEPYDDFTLVRNEQITSPFSFFGWVVLNPDYHDSGELEQIMRHERVHVRARHSIDMVGAELICIGLWFNPAAYLFRYLLHQTLEFSADRAVLAEGVDAKAYQYNLVKVSLAGGSPDLTNHFSRSQLKSRIVMLNKPESSPTTWLKYPVVCIAALTVVAAFARPSAQTLNRYVPAPVAETIAAVIASAPVALPERVAKPKTTETFVDSFLKPRPSVQPTTVQPDTLAAVSTPDSARVSPSRYMAYQGDHLYWIITPKTSFGDLAIMKQEFEQHGYKMQVQALKYDPLYSYITDIKITIIRPTAGISDFEETGVDGKPIRSYGGFNGLNKSKNVAAVGSYPFNENFFHLPYRLLQTVRDEERSVTKFIYDNKLKYLMADGIKISAKYAPTSSTYNVSGLLTRPDLIKKYGIRLNADSTLDISDTHLPVFINNEMVTNEDLKRINTKRLSTLISSEEWGKNGQLGMVKAFLFYVNENN